ncbi:MAG: hemerythrin domain-containing protein [Geothrix sp.]|nr:hemerythrin domain-containing protein [Geothrix sp.]
MQLIEDLRAEHELIEQVLGSLRAFVRARLAGQGDPADGTSFLAFFRRFAGDFHHDKEEQVLFRALVDRAEIPEGRGPIAAITSQHRDMAQLLDGLEPLLGASLQAEVERAGLQALAVEYSHALWRHMDAENSVLFPEGQERLRRFHVQELPSRPMTAVEQQAREAALGLLVRYPPEHDPTVHRGDGCVACPSYGTTCDGLEQEWWTELDWEDRDERMRGD